MSSSVKDSISTTEAMKEEERDQNKENKENPFQADRGRNATKAMNKEKFALPNNINSNSWGYEADEINKEGRILPREDQ